MSGEREIGPIALLGFGSFQDGSFELIVRGAESNVETTLKGQLDSGQLEIISKILPTCSYVKANSAKSIAPKEVIEVLTWMEERAQNSKSFGSHCHAYEVAARKLSDAISRM